MKNESIHKNLKILKNQSPNTQVNSFVKNKNKKTSQF